MVTVFLRGGLGNQMFQYAAGLALAKKNDTELLLDTTFLNDRFPRRNFAYRTYDLGIFALDAHLTALSRLSATVPIPGLWLGIDLGLATMGNILGRAGIIVKEKDGRKFDPDILNAPKDCVLWGRWQSEKYFKDIADDVRAAFAFRYPLPESVHEYANKIRSSNSVSLHVRRGDFATSASVVRLMGEMDLAYYDRAARYIADKEKSPEFFVFSDDIAWCKVNLKLPFPATYVPAECAGPHASYHLELMALARHNIIANSTFSWWGAWLNKNSEKVVVAPARWYADGNDGDTVPSGWARVK